MRKKSREPTDRASEYGWSAVHDGDPVHEEVVDYVRLEADEYAGPFRGRDCAIASDYDDMHAMLGLSRQLYDDVMTWNDEAAALSRRAPRAERRRMFERRLELLDRLESEVTPGIEVARPHVPRWARTTSEDSPPHATT